VITLPPQIDSATLNALPTAIWAGNSAGQCRFANDALARLLSTPAADLLGFGWLRFVPEHEQIDFLPKLQRLGSSLSSFRTRHLL
jgi:PAS domain-containing protein